MYQPPALWGFDWVITEGLPPTYPTPRLGGFLTVKFGGLLESLSLAQTGGSSTSRGVAIDCAGMRKGRGSLDCAYLREGWGTPRWQIGDLEGGGYPSVANRGSRGWGVPLGASIHDVEIWVSGGGEKEGGK